MSCPVFYSHCSQPTDSTLRPHTVGRTCQPRVIMHSAFSAAHAGKPSHRTQSSGLFVDAQQQSRPPRSLATLPCLRQLARRAIMLESSEVMDHTVYKGMVAYLVLFAAEALKIAPAHLVHGVFQAERVSAHINSLAFSVELRSQGQDLTHQCLPSSPLSRSTGYRRRPLTTAPCRKETPFQ